MDFGKLKYHVVIKSGNEGLVAKTLRLTLIDSRDEAVLSSQGLSELRKKRIMRLTTEAQEQGLLLSYEDLNALLLSSVSTLKRDINILEKKGYSIPLKGRRKN
ncbi:MAG: DUF1670 domain-containing protein [Nitrospira sp.]|nr:DUF1670 domain-containing protein [Nitrospira sp.]